MTDFASLSPASGGRMTTIANLHRWSCPSAVSWLVASVIIGTIERHAAWWLTHIGEEVLEVMPTFTYRNASSSPIGKSFVVWVQASLQHRVPTSIKRRIFSRAAVSEIELMTTTSTTSGLSPSQIAGRGNDGVSTIANATPSRLPFVKYDNETTKALAGDVAECWHDEVSL